VWGQKAEWADAAQGLLPCTGRKTNSYARIKECFRQVSDLRKKDLPKTSYFLSETGGFADLIIGSGVITELDFLSSVPGVVGRSASFGFFSFFSKPGSIAEEGRSRVLWSPGGEPPVQPDSIPSKEKETK